MKVTKLGDYENILAQIPIGGVFVKLDRCYIKTGLSARDEAQTPLVVCVDIECGDTDTFYESEVVCPVCAECRIWEETFIEGNKSQ